MTACLQNSLKNELICHKITEISEEIINNLYHITLLSLLN